MLPLIDRKALVKSSPFECPYVNGLINAIDIPLPLAMECKQALMKCVTFQTLQAQEVLLEAGQMNDRLYWIETGLVRFCSDADADVTTGFCSEGAEETTVLLSVGYADLQQLFALYPELIHAFYILYGHLLEVHHARTALLRYRTSLERYKAFIALHPHLPNRLLVKHIASYLGIHRVTMCKIRKQLAQKKA